MSSSTSPRTSLAAAIRQVNAALNRARLPETIRERLADEPYVRLMDESLRAAEESRDDDAYRLAAEWQAHALSRIDELRKWRAP